jgi:hypothetical protein
MKKPLVSLPALLVAGLFVMQNAEAAPKYNAHLVKALSNMASHPERSGNPQRIMILDGFRDVDVEGFLNTHFENIQNVMFTGVIRTDKHGKPKRNKRTGGYLYEDDGC